MNNNTSPSQSLEEEKYEPIYCDHKKPNGFSAYDLQSHSSGSGPEWMREFNYWVCLNCGEIKVSGKNLVDDKIQYFSEELSIYMPDAIAAIVKNCNYMNAETDGYIPFVQSQKSIDMGEVERVIYEQIERIKYQPHISINPLIRILKKLNLPSPPTI